MKNRTVLIVDDDNGVINSLERVLRKEPYRRLYASSGLEAQEIINRDTIHLVISDLLMPGIDGLTLLKWIEENKPEIIRMVLSIKSDSKTILESINKGNIRFYIPKPWDNTELKIIINQGIDFFNLQEDRRKLMKELEEHNRKLEQKVTERTNQLLAIRSEAEIGKHTSQIVHNLNNTLNNVFGSLEVLGSTLSEENPDFNRVKKFFAYTKISAGSLSKIVAEILIRARGKDSLQSEEININQLIKNELLYWEMDPVFKYKITKKMKLDKCMPSIQGNPVQIKQILDNIIKNAIDAMEESKEKQLSIETGVENGLILIKITDTGEGIPEEDLSKIFLPGFTTKPIGKGTGLGLASVKTMVESYSGTIKIQSEKNKGTSVTISLPEKSNHAFHHLN